MKYLPLRVVISSAAFVAASVTTAEAQSLLYSYQGQSNGVRLGWSLDALDDVNGDGRPDFVLTAPGDPVRPVRVHSGATGGFLYAANVQDLGASFGSCVTGLGDVDSDGSGDFAVAVSGGNFIRALSGTSGSVLWTSPVRGGGGPRRITRLGDLNGDGKNDLAVLTSSLLFRVYSGANGSVLGINTPGNLHWFAVDDAGDVNGDGISDILLGSVLAYSEKGAVRIASGADGSVLQEKIGPIGNEVCQGTPKYWLGHSVAGVGDWDGDQVPDFAAGQPGHPNAPPCEGRVAVWSGATGELLQVFGESVSGYFGSHIASGGDLDHDGVPELLARTVTSVQIYGRNGLAIGEVSMPNHSYIDATNLAGLGDLDGDGRFEFGAGHAPNITFAGDVWIYSVDCSAPQTYCTAAPNSAGPGAPIDYLGGPSIANGKLTLTVSGGPPSMPGLFIYAPQQTMLPFGDGYLCVSGGIVRIPPAVVFDGSGNLARALDYDAPPLGSGPNAVTPGSTWNFQLWYRDLPAGMSGFNLSDGLEVTFCP